ncbi:MAG: PTS sugar transporter subunit IIA [Syntrophomonadaceae bacterium]|jgi:PTS system galactitol-specific IIA component
MKYFAIKGSASTDEEAIKLCADKLYEEGCVTDQFANNCIRREKKFPTGMPSELPVAMPHSEAAGVVENAVCVLVLDKPVNFRRMDDDTVEIPAEAVFNLAVKDPSKHMYILQNLMGLFYQTDVLTDLLKTDLKEMPSQLEKILEKNS